MIRLALFLIACASAAHAQTVLVKPYVQPGDGSTLTGTDVKVLTWVTDQKPGTFTVEYGWRGTTPKTAQPERIALDFAKVKPKPKTDKPKSTDKPKDSTKPADPAKPSDPSKPSDPAKPSTVTPTKPATAKPESPATRPADPKAPDSPSTNPPATTTPGTSIPKNPLEDAATTLEEAKEKVLETFKVIEEKEQHFYRYRAVLPDLPFNTEVGYRVRLGATVVREGIVKTRATPDRQIRFIAVGDMASNKKEQFGIAYEMSLQKPDFLVALGDIVYPSGRVLQYMNHFWPCYNDVAKPSPKTGAPIAATVPIYPVIGNHDADMHRLPDYPDAYSAFYWFSIPKNSPGLGPWSTPLGKDPIMAAAFKTAAGAEYPAMSNYSFDYGPAHFVMLDANSYAMKANDGIIPWLERDLTESKQPWKFVCFHQPAFHTSKEHYSQQKMRLFQPIFERCGVDVVFAGHVHNYQRSKPLKFTPTQAKPDSKGRVNGDFVLDSTFDGLTDTTPEGIIHIVSGGGGASLYSVNLEKTIAGLKKDHAANYVPITDKYVANKHSFSLIDLSPKVFELRQISIEGKEVDRFRITK